MGLHKKHFEVLNPTYQALSIRKDRRKVLSKPIFKGYMFFRALLDSESHLEVLKTPGVVEILRNRKGPTLNRLKMFGFWKNMWEIVFMEQI